MSTSRKLNVALCLLMLGICGVAMFFGGRWWLAERYYFDTQKQLEAWTRNQAVSLPEWEEAHAGLSRAIELQSKRGDYYFILGMVHEARASAPYAIDPILPPAAQQQELIRLISADFQRALAAYRDSLELRPIWPTTWSRLFFLKGILGEYDEEFIAAYRNMFLYGKNKNDQQLTFTLMSLQFFPILQGNDESRPLQMAHLGKVLSEPNPQQHVELMTQSGLLPQICAAVLATGTALVPFSARACEDAQSGKQQPGPVPGQ